jgi:hypothetical protein
MPIDLSSYTPAMRKFIRARNMAAIYVATYAGQAEPCRIAHAIDVFGHLRTMAATTAQAIEVHELVWMPSVMTAKVIEAHVHAMLSGKLVRQKWFDVPAADAIEAVNAIVGRFNFGRVFSHAELMDKMAAERLKAAAPALTVLAAG